MKKLSILTFIFVLCNYSFTYSQELSVKEIKALMKEIKKEYLVETNYDNFEQKLWIHPLSKCELVNLDHESLKIEVYFEYRPNEKEIGEKRIKFVFSGHNIDMNKMSFLIGKASDKQTRYFLNLISFESKKSFYQGSTNIVLDILYTAEIENIIKDIINRENMTPVAIKIEGENSSAIVATWKKDFIKMITPIDNAYLFLKNKK